MSSHRQIAAMPSTAFVAVGCLVALVSSRTFSSENPPTQVDKDGTLRLREVTVPPSELWSPEFKALYTLSVTTLQERIKASAPGASAKPHPSREAPKAEWDKFYASLDRALAPSIERAKTLYPVKVEDTEIAGVHVGIIIPMDGVPPENKNRVLINMHAGGFYNFTGLSFGQLESIPVSSLGKFKVITLDYRQAPDYQYPAASEDVEAVYRELLKEYRPASIGLFGCSAGGVLTAQMMAWFQEKGLPRPGAAGILCSAPKIGPKWPRGDSSFWGLGVIPDNRPPGSVPAISNASGWYFEGADSTDPKAYPGSSDAVLARFPPTLLLVGTRESAMSVAVAAHAKFLKLGVDSSLYVVEGGWHTAHVTAVGTPEAHDANAYIARWFDRHLAR
jgi:acetyl esterase/lipase